MKRLRIVIADDDLDDQQLIKDAAKEAGLSCEIISVYNGLQLMDFLKKQQAYHNAETPDGILLDLNMPLLNGYEVLQKIRSDDNLRHLIVHVLSTSTSGYDMERALEYGANGYHSKSRLFEDLKELMKKVCNELHRNMN